MNAFNSNVSIGDAYKDGYADGFQDDMGSPVLRPKRLHLCLEESPPPKLTEVSRPSASASHKQSSSNRPKIRGSLGDAVLIRFMTDGRDPNIANYEADRDYSDRSELDDAEKQNAEEPEPEDPEETDIDIDDFVETETGADPNPRPVTEQVEQAKHVDMTEASRPTLPSIASLTATANAASTSTPTPAVPTARQSPVLAAYQRDIVMEDSDEDQPTMPSRHYQISSRADKSAEHDEAADTAFPKCIDTEMEQGLPSPDRPPHYPRETPTTAQSQPPKEITALAALALARTDMSRQNSGSKDTDTNDGNDGNDGKNGNNGKSSAAPPPTERVDRPERTPLPDSRNARFRSATLKSEPQLLSTSAATSPADPSPAYYASSSNSGHTPVSIASTSTPTSVLAPSPYATSGHPSPAYSSPGVHQHSPRRLPTMDHNRVPPNLLPSLQMQPTAYSPPPPGSFDQIKLSPITLDAISIAARSGRSFHDKGIASGANTTTTLPSIATYIESREKIEGSPALPHASQASHSAHPSPGIQLPPITGPTSPVSTYAGTYAGAYSSRDVGARDMRDNRSPVTASSRAPTLPPLLHFRHPLPTSSTIPASSGQQSPLPHPTRLTINAPISALSSSTRNHGSHENLHKRHQVQPIFPKTMHQPQLAPMPDMQSQARSQAHSQGQAGQPRVSVSATTATTAAPSSSGTYKCTVEGCTAAPFVTQYLLNSHANVHSDERPHYCPVEGCPRSKPGSGFKRKNEMIRHGLVHKSPGYVCPFCPDREHKYPRPDNLLRHVRAHHKEKSKDDAELRDVLAQRPDGPSRGRRRRN